MPVKNQDDTSVIDREKEDEKVQKPKKYKVIFHNDDFTPFSFVEFLLERYFRKTHDESTRIAMEVDKTGAAVAGVYTHDIAETKIAQCEEHIQKEEHPLMLSMEPE